MTLAMAAHPTDLGEKLYEGKAKIIFRAPDGSLSHYFKDSATAFNGQKKAEIEGKGQINCGISSLLFDYLEKKGIETHFLGQKDERVFRTRALSMIPAEVVVRNYVAGSLARRLKLDEGEILTPPVIEWYLKDDAKGDPQVSRELLISLYKQSPQVLDKIEKQTQSVNSILTEVWRRAGLLLVDFKLEFGVDKTGKLFVADEISPDTCRLWDAQTKEKLDKDRFRFDLGDLMTGYRRVHAALKLALGVP